jgi:hypothetical protein
VCYFVQVVFLTSMKVPCLVLASLLVSSVHGFIQPGLGLASTRCVRRQGAVSMAAEVR